MLGFKKKRKLLGGGEDSDGDGDGGGHEGANGEAEFDLIHEVPPLKLSSLLFKGEGGFGEVVGFGFEVFQLLAAVKDEFDVGFHNFANLFDLMLDSVESRVGIRKINFAFKHLPQIQGAVGGQFFLVRSQGNADHRSKHQRQSFTQRLGPQQRIISSKDDDVTCRPVFVANGELNASNGSTAATLADVVPARRIPALS